MNFSKYYTGIIVRVILIVLSSLILAFLSFKTNYLYSVTVLIILVIAETWGLIRYILRRRDDIKRMLEYIKENNPTLFFSQTRDYPFKELGDFLNEIGDIVREVRIEKESQLQYMNHIVEQVGTGLISFDKEGKIEIINQAAKELLGITKIDAIDLLGGIYPGFPDILKKATAGEQKVIALKSRERLLQLAIRVSIFKIGQKEIRLAALQDIKNELDEKEMDSWQKLIRVLTHEIINSVTPITSLTSTISGFFKKGEQVLGRDDISDEVISEALTGLGYIEERGKNLINFVSKFRSLTKLPVPKFEKVSLTTLIEGIVILKRDELSAKGIGLNFTDPVENIYLFCDRSLIEHVLLNLVNNASDAILAKSNGNERSVEIIVSGGDGLHPVVFVRDNGIGIPDDIVENVFIPFFTTKEQGSGIGLSLSRQIMKLHGGTISVHSKPGVETVFSLIF